MSVEDSRWAKIRIHLSDDVNVDNGVVKASDAINYLSKKLNGMLKGKIDSSRLCATFSYNQFPRFSAFVKVAVPLLQKSLNANFDGDKIKEKRV